MNFQIPESFHCCLDWNTELISKRSSTYIEACVAFVWVLQNIVEPSSQHILNAATQVKSRFRAFISSLWFAMHDSNCDELGSFVLSIVVLLNTHNIFFWHVAHMVHARQRLAVSSWLTAHCRNTLDLK